MGRLDGKVAVVTGVGSGMGEATAKLFAHEGAKVVLADFNEETMNETLKDIESNGGEAVAIQTDVSNEEDVNAMIQKAVDEYGKLDILVNVAGIFDGMASIENTSTELYERVMNINVNGPFYASRKAVEIFNEQGTGGSIINVSSLAGRFGSRGGAAYTMSKHATIGLTRNIAAFYGSHGDKNIRANAIAPGVIATGMTADAGADYDELGVATSSQNGEFHTGEPLDIANAALFLASSDAKFINGDVLTVDAGFTVR